MANHYITYFFSTFTPTVLLLVMSSTSPSINKIIRLVEKKSDRLGIIIVDPFLEVLQLQKIDLPKTYQQYYNLSRKTRDISMQLLKKLTESQARVVMVMCPLTAWEKLPEDRGYDESSEQTKANEPFEEHGDGLHPMNESFTDNVQKDIRSPPVPPQSKEKTTFSQVQ